MQRSGIGEGPMSVEKKLQRRTTEALKSAGKRDKVKVIIGGAPVTEAYAHQIEADGCAPDCQPRRFVDEGVARKIN